MIRLAKRYSNRPPAEWPPLFFRILQNRTRDWGRRQVVRRRVMVVLGREAAEDLSDPVAAMPAPAAEQPDRELERDSAMQALESALRALPQRQAEAFMLRNFEGLDVAQTARAMGCSAGSVKTHYSRAVHRLRVLLGEHWE